MSGEERVGMYAALLLLLLFCGSWLAREGGLAANQPLTDVLDLLWELACQRRRPCSQPVADECTRSTVGAGLPAKAALQPTRTLLT